MSPRNIWATLTPRMKGVSVFLGIIATGLAVITGLPPAWRQLGLPAVATEYHVAKIVEDRVMPLETAVRDIKQRVSEGSQETAEVRRSQVEEALSKWQIELAKTTDANLRVMIESRIAELTLERITILRRIDQIQRERYGPH